MQSIGCQELTLGQVKSPVKPVVALRPGLKFFSTILPILPLTPKKAFVNKWQLETNNGKGGLSFGPGMRGYGLVG